MTKLQEIKTGVEKALTPYIINRTLYAHLESLGVKKPQYISLKKANNINYDTAVFWIRKLNLQVDLSYLEQLNKAIQKTNSNQVSIALGVNSSIIHRLADGTNKPRLNLLDKINNL